MKVLELNTEKGWRGGERQTCYNIAGLTGAGIRVELLCRKGRPLEAAAKELKVPVHAASGAISAMLFLACKGRQYDILHAQTAKAQFYCVITRLFHRRPIVYTRRLDFVPKGSLTRMKYRLTHRTVAISGPIQKILGDFGVPDVAVISDAVTRQEPDMERINQFIHDNRLAGKKIIGTTAAFVPHKDPLTMVRTVKELSLTRQDFVFLHFGEGELKEPARAMAESLGLDSIYRFAGFTDHIERMFPLFDVFAMSSEQEGLGSSVLDAFVHKVPVVSTKAGGLREVVQDRGVLCEVKDHKALAQGMNELLNNSGLREQLCTAAYDYALREHSVNRIAGQYLELFKTLSLGRGGSLRANAGFSDSSRKR